MDNKNDQITSGGHLSYWLNSAPVISFTKLEKHIECEVVVVGGGIAGVTTAYCLVRSGRKVVLVEDGNIGSGETGRTTAHAVNVFDDRYYTIEQELGEQNARLLAESHSAAIDFIERAVLDQNINCNFRRLPGYLFPHPSDSDDSLEKELRACRRAGVKAEELLYIPGVRDNLRCIKFPAQATFHPLRYLNALCNAIVRLGGHIYTGTHASKIDENGIHTRDGYTVKAKHVVVATNTPVNNKYLIHTKQEAYRTYVIAAKVKKNSLPDALWWDTGDFSVNKEMPPYHYVRIEPFTDTHDMLICGGEDHPTGTGDDARVNEEDRYGLLEAWTRERFPIEEILYTWSGQVEEPIDGVAFIGRNPHDKKNIYVVSGDSGNGITHGTIAGMLITDLINGIENPWEKLYDPSRGKILQIGKNMIKEFANGALAFFKFDKKTQGQSLGKIKKGEGKVLTVDGEKFAAYRDESGELFVLNAECRHMGCIVKWNNDEKTWDCGCHGSRYTHEGKVVNGPANEDLPNYSYRYQDKTEKHDII